LSPNDAVSSSINTSMLFFQKTFLKKPRHSALIAKCKLLKKFIYTVNFEVFYSHNFAAKLP